MIKSSSKRHIIIVKHKLVIPVSQLENGLVGEFGPIEAPEEDKFLKSED